MPASLQIMLTGGAANADPNLSLGGVGSADQISAVAMNNLFDNSTPPESLAGFTDYRAVDILNNGDAVAQNVQLFISSETPSPDSQVDLSSEGVDPAAPITLPDEADSTNQLAGQAFTHNISTNKLALPDIPVNSRCRIWLRRTVSAGAVNNNDDLLGWSIWFA